MSKIYVSVMIQYRNHSRNPHQLTHTISYNDRIQTFFSVAHWASLAARRTKSSPPRGSLGSLTLAALISPELRKLRNSKDWVRRIEALGFCFVEEMDRKTPKNGMEKLHA